MAFVKWLQILLQKDTAPVLDQFTTDSGSLGPLIDLLSLEAQFADVLDILPHVSPRQALVEVFGMYDIAFKVGYFGS